VKIINTPKKLKMIAEFGFPFGGNRLHNDNHMNLTNKMKFSNLKLIVSLIGRRNIKRRRLKLYPKTDNMDIFFFSLGMSWVSGRMLHRTPWSAMLDSVKASILGLGGINCASFYPECDLERERIKRRRRKRK